MISRCAVASSSDDIFITALDAVHWTIGAWAAVTQLTISNTCQTTGFKPSLNQETTKTSVDSDNEVDKETNSDDVSSALRTLDMPLAHVSIGGRSLSASEFVEVDDETPAFNEWNDPRDHLIVVNKGFDDNRNKEEEDDEDLMNETPSLENTICTVSLVFTEERFDCISFALLDETNESSGTYCVTI